MFDHLMKFLEIQISKDFSLNERRFSSYHSLNSEFNNLFDTQMLVNTNSDSQIS